MSKKINFGRRVSVAIAASAVALTMLASSATADPLPGTCKNAAEVGTAASPAAAQQLWVAIVAGKFGNKWANWVGAKNKTVIPMGVYFQAVAKPCFYQPVT